MQHLFALEQRDALLQKVAEAAEAFLGLALLWVPVLSCRSFALVQHESVYRSAPHLLCRTQSSQVPVS